MATLDARLAARSAAALFLVGAIPMAVAAARGSTSSPGAMAALAATAFAIAVALARLERANRASLGVTYLAELAGLAIVAGVVAITGKSGSEYPPFFFFPLVHVAVFQPRWRVVLAWALGIAAYLAPLAYETHVQPGFGAIAATTAPVAVLVGAIIHVAVDALRREHAELTRSEAEARQIAEVDGLTGVGNYRRFRRALSTECARSRRNDQPFALIVLDLDGFKAINDELGHQAGDDALRRVSEGLAAELRAEDVLCRQGGDEFAVIAVGAGEREATELANRLTIAVRVAADTHLDHPLSATAGHATYGDPATTPDDLLARADGVLRESKHDGRPMPGSASPRHARARRLAALGALSRALALAKDELGVVEVGALHAADALRASTVEIWRRRRPGAPPTLVARAAAPDGDGATASRGGPTPDPEHLEEVLRTNHVLTPNSARSGQMLVPISHAGDASGVLFTASSDPDATSDERRRMALAMAAQISRALAAVEAFRTAGPAAARRLIPAAARGDATEHVADLGREIGHRLGMTSGDLSTLARAAEVHDVGLIGIPAGLLLRPSRLTREEERILHEHPLIAERLLRPLPRLQSAARVLRHVHERYDGTGYPDGLAGAQIPLASRVLHAAIALEAMVSPRPYRAAVSLELAREELHRVAGSQLDPDVVGALDRVLETAPPEWARAATSAASG